MGKYQMKTRKDYDFFECSSAFQKSIRRGNEKEALFFGFELYASGYSKYVWKRMLVMASEDIGLGDNNVCVQINALHSNWKTINEGSGANGGSVPFIHAIMIMSRAKKSRITDEAKIWVMKQGVNFEIPDHALDIHTLRGKKMGRSFDFFVNEAAKLENEVKVDDQEFYRNHFIKYLDDFQNKTIPAEGYDKRNVVHKSAKDMDKWKQENSQSDLFD